MKVQEKPALDTASTLDWCFALFTLALHSGGWAGLSLFLNSCPDPAAFGKQMPALTSLEDQGWVTAGQSLFVCVLFGCVCAPLLLAFVSLRRLVQTKALDSLKPVLPRKRTDAP